MLDSARPVIFRIASSLLFALSLSISANPEQLPIKSYTTAEGLPVDYVKRIMRDSHGFLWFCTRDGLSKFDGYQFTNYGKEQGLPHPNVNDLIESRDGSYWVATNGAGVSSFNPTERLSFNTDARFKVYSLDSNPASNRVNRLCEDQQGRIWAGSDTGLFYFDKTQDRFIRAISDEIAIYSIIADRQGVLWMGVENQLWRRHADGRLVRYSFQAVRDLGRIFSLLEDNEGKLWVGSWYAGLLRLDVPLLPHKDSMLQVGKTKAALDQYTTVQGAVIGAVEDLHQSPDGHLWIVASPDFTTGLGGGLFEFYGNKFRRYGKAQGLRSDHIKGLADDGQTDLWLGSIDGAMKIASNGFTTFGQSDGLATGAASIFENSRGELCTITERGMVLNRFEDGRFIPIRFNVPKALENKRLWGNSQITFQDHQGGDWWVPTSKGLMRFADVERPEQLSSARPKAHYLLEGDGDVFDIFRLFEDSRGDIWLSLASAAKNGLVKWERATEEFRYYTEADGVPPLNPPSSFCEDDKGNLWIGLYGGGLLRWRQGRFTFFGQEDGLPSGLIYHLYLDRSRRLWIASSSDGVGRIDDTETDRPQFVRLTAADGLSSNVVYSVAEDNFGGIYFRTTRGVDRLNPITGNIKRYTASDGLPAGDGLAFRDSHGALWFSAFYGVARLMPAPDAPQPPPIFITGVRINGDARAIADLGEAQISGLTLNPSENHLQIDFVGLAFGTGEALRYQYKLEGADADWQALTSLRAVNYANLAPGAYRFVVRAMNAEGQFSPTAASVEFTILSPIWQRPWFLSIIAMLVVLIVYALYRYRIARFLEIERVRTRIASDLHDDIGANLTKIAILTEVAQQQFGREENDGGPLSSAARISRESLDSMGDIVWAINPKRDSLRELARRMRGFATDIFTSRNIDFSFHAVDQDLDLKLGPDIRRDVFLIFKEAVNNAVRHSGCSMVAIELKIAATSFVLIVRDDGKGFDAAAAGEGNGLVSMRRRAESIDGTLDIRSNVGKGTSVTLTAPIGHRHMSVAKTN